MPSVIATPPDLTLPGGGALNPWFDQPAPFVGVLGIPWWFVISCGLVLLLIIVNLFWIFKLRRMAAVKGHKEIQKKAGPDDVEVWLFGKTQKMIIECLKYSGGVASYHSPTRISQWHLTSPMAMAHIGGYPSMIVSDDYDQSRDPVSEIAICHACEEFNRDQKWWAEFREKVAQARKTGEELPDWAKEAIAKPIKSFTDYRERGNLLLKLRYPEGIPIPAYNIFNPVLFRKYFPKGRDATFFGGVELRKARKLMLKIVQKGFWEKHLPIMIIAAIGIVMMIAAWNAPLGK